MVRRHEVQVLRRAGHSLVETAKLVGVSQRTVQRVEAETAVSSFDTGTEREQRKIGRPSKAEPFRSLLAMHGIVCSMSRTGNCYDNAAMESETFASIRRGKDLAFDYIEVFYNKQRRHSSIGYIAPAERERRYYESRTTQMARAA